MNREYIVFLDDEEPILRAIERSFRNSEFRTSTFSTPQAALDFIRIHEVSAVFSDYRMPAIDGLSFLKQVQEVSPRSARAILSGYAEESLIRGALQTGEIASYLIKPVASEALRHEIQRLQLVNFA